MSAIDNGGPAFPHAQRCWDNDAMSWAVHSIGGMTLRDWFAGIALNGCQRPSADGSEYSKAKDIADAAYEIADAMLAARKEGV
jgi:hypothetical protein